MAPLNRLLVPFLASLTLIQGVVLSQDSTVPGRRVAYAVQGTPKIDGKLDPIWESTVALETNRPVAALNDPAIAVPASAEVRCLWNDESVFLLAVVTDKNIHTHQGADWDRDSIEIFLDEYLARRTEYGAGDGQYRVDAAGKVSYGAGPTGNVQAVVRRLPKGYLVEMEIKFSNLKPKPGARIGFEAQVNDTTGIGRRQALMKWNDPTNRSWRDPSTFGTLVFSTRESLKADQKKFGTGTESQESPANPSEGIRAEDRVPDWAADAIYYQLFPERFRNGDSANDPTRDSLEFPELIPENWKVTPWTQQWYARDDWEKKIGEHFYDDGVFHRRYGGDLQGVLDKLDYLQSLGINVIYFNPVFYARSLHKYDGNSFHHIDPHFGPDPQGDFALMKTETADPASWNWTAADKLFLNVVKQSHARGIRVIVDGVFNHTGRDFFAFKDIAENGKESRYLDWYTVEEFDDPATEKNEFKYKCWWGVDTLPEFADNRDGTDLHPAPKAYIFEATRRWMDPNGDGDPVDGIDGWRLDVANEVPNQFWKDWNRHVRKLNREAFTVAEIWEDAGDYLGNCGFSSTMNYHGFAFPVKGFLIDGRMKASEFAAALNKRRARHPVRVQYALQNLIDSHDTDRLASMIVNSRKNRPYQSGEKFDYDVGERVSARWFKEYDVRAPGSEDYRLQRLVALFQFTYLGAPMVYYGTETGMDGADDPDDRMPMVWDDLEYEPRTRGPWGTLSKPSPIRFSKDLHGYYQALIQFRKLQPALNRGAFQVIATDDAQKCIVFTRQIEDEIFVVALNRSRQETKIQLENSELAQRIWQVRFNSIGPGDFARVTRDGSDVQLTLPSFYGSVWELKKDE